jgi:hypothetical protein
MQIIERVMGHYEVEDVDFGRVYRWHPESILIECKCGQTTAITATSSSTCEECGAEHSGMVREDLRGRLLGDKELHPWRYYPVAGSDEGAAIPY